jgi:dipeptide transport system substrate-binding protein
MRFAKSAALGGTLAVALLVAVAPGAEARQLTFCNDAPAEGFDPALYTSGATLDASSQAFYDRLVAFAPGSTAIVPALATSWDVSPDGKQYTFHLRDDVNFAAGIGFAPTRPLNADDVVFSLARQSDPKNPYFAYAGGAWPYYTALGLNVLVKSVAKVDAATVRITLTRPDPSILGDLAMDFASIVSKEYADALLKAKTPQLLDSSPIGTGPFIFSRNDNGRVVTVANSGYWGGAPKVDGVTFLPVASPADRLAKLKAGECDVAAEPDAATLKDARSDSDLAVATIERADVATLAFNTTTPPFNDARVRQALGMAIDRQAIVDTVYGGDAVAAKALLPASMAGTNGEAAADETYDVDGAKQLLAAAGVSNLKLKLLATKAPRPYSPDLAATANLIAADLAKVGVEASVEVPDTLGAYLRQSSDKKRDGAVLIGWTSDNGDAASFLALLLSCDGVGKSNRAQWCNADFDKAIDAARRATDPMAEFGGLNEAQSIAAREVPLTALVHGLVAVPMRKGVSGVAADPLGRHNFAKADISP